MKEGDGTKRAECEHGKDKGRDIWRGADDKNGEFIKVYSASFPIKVLER